MSLIDRYKRTEKKQQQKMPSNYHHCTRIQTFCFCYYSYLQCSDSHLRPSGKPVPCNAEQGIIAYGRVNLSKCKA
jgi:hypothetical protein